jgi:hypothetical protein
MADPSSHGFGVLGMFSQLLGDNNEFEVRIFKSNKPMRHA